MLFIVSLALMTIILAMFGISFEEALVLTIACLTTTGPIIEMVGIEPSLDIRINVFSKIGFGYKYGSGSS